MESKGLIARIARSLFRGKAPRDADADADAKPAQRPSEEELAAYEAFVAEMAAKADGRVLLNRDAAHAKVALSRLLATAEREVWISTPSLRRETYGSPEVVAQALAFLRRSPQAVLTVWTEPTLAPDAAFVLARLSGEAPGRVVVAGPHRGSGFAVADRRHYRRETDAEGMSAAVAFGAPATAARLVDAAVAATVSPDAGLPAEL